LWHKFQERATRYGTNGNAVSSRMDKNKYYDDDEKIDDVKMVILNWHN
jgi:hypothetical protein